MFANLLMYYCPTEPESILIRLIYLLEQLLAGTIHDLDTEDPTKKQNALAVLDVLTGWMPFDAGRGSIHFSVFGVGSLDIKVDGLNLTIEAQHELPYGKGGPQLIVLKTSQGSLPDWSDEGMQLAEAILVLASHENRFCAFVWESEWEWTTNLRPSPEWIATRAAAKAAGTEMPRAIDWLQDAALKSMGG